MVVDIRVGRNDKEMYWSSINGVIPEDFARYTSCEFDLSKVLARISEGIRHLPFGLNLNIDVHKNLSENERRFVLSEIRSVDRSSANKIYFDRDYRTEERILF